MRRNEKRHAGARKILPAVFSVLLFTGLLSQAHAADSMNLAPGFETLPKNAKIVIMPTDIELFSVSAGGVLEPKADWTESASRHFKSALMAKKTALGIATVELSDIDADDLAEVNALHAAIARSIALHHFGPSMLQLPTKAGKLDWSMGDPVRAIKEKTGADYALFSWVRDSYASGERIAAMVVLALVGVAAPGGAQIGYASLVDLNSGRVLWFNRLARSTGDLREADKASETLDTLLDKFPAPR
jgi:hypothetical protein